MIDVTYKTMSKTDSNKVIVVKKTILNFLFDPAENDSITDFKAHFNIRISALRYALSDVITAEFANASDKQSQNETFVKHLIDTNLDLFRFILEADLQQALDRLNANL